MSEPEQPTQVAPPGPVEGLPEEGGVSDSDNGAHPVNEGVNVIDLLKQDVQELASPEDVYIPIKGYERTGLAVRYHFPDKGRELDMISSRVRREFRTDYERNLHIGIDTMIHLCSGLYIKHPDGTDEWVELDPELTGAPVQFDRTLAQAMGWNEVQTARQVIKRLFGNNELAINVHAERLNRWLANTKANIDAEFWQTGE